MAQPNLPDLEGLTPPQDEQAMPASNSSSSEENLPDLEGLSAPEEGGSEVEDEHGDAIDHVVDDAADSDPDKSGQIRTVAGAHLVYKRQQDDGTYEELWIYKTTELRTEAKIKREIISGTDIPPNSRTSPDGSQQYELWNVGNVELLRVQGLPS